jgi:hypothetical protein
LIALSLATLFLLPSFAFGQDDDSANAVYVTKLKASFPEDGTMAEYDSLKTLFMENVINKNKYIVSEMRLAHWFTPDVRDYFIITEYKNLDDFEKAGDENNRLAKEWLKDDDERKAFFKAFNRYFENWHGDYIYRLDAKK